MRPRGGRMAPRFVAGKMLQLKDLQERPRREFGSL